MCRLAQRRDDAVGECLRLIPGRDVRLQHDKFVAAQPGDGVVDTHGLPQPFRGGLEDEVAAIVAERIVDVLEMIEVDEMHGKLRAKSRQRGKNAFQALDQTCAICQTGQRVMMSEITDAAVASLFLAGSPIPGDCRYPKGRRRQGGQRHDRGEEGIPKPGTRRRFIDEGGDGADRLAVDDHRHIGAGVVLRRVELRAFDGIDHGLPGFDRECRLGAPLREIDRADLTAVGDKL